MFYNSINNKLNIKNFFYIFLNNISKDENLFFPFKISKINYIFKLYNKNYINFSFYIIKLFINFIPDYILFELLKSSYLNFPNNIILLNDIEDNKILNLNSGPTLTFKDIAMNPFAKILNYISKKINKKSIIFCATSGDTGSAAINSFKNYKSIKVFIFHPFNMISNIQRKQMTNIKNNNIINISIIGNFDLSQFLIKKIFKKIKNNNYFLITSINSINWFRIILQSIYYSYSSLRNYKNKLINYYIPSGNFGNALSAYISKLLGFPIGKIFICNNDNDYLNNLISNNIIKNNILKKTLSPSIDISIPSNISRIYNKNKNNLNKINNFFLSNKLLNKDILHSIEYFYQIYKKIYDPHTITSITSYFKNKINNNNFLVSTSYPIKFFLVLKKIIPNIKIRFNIKNIFLLKEKYKIFSQNFKIIINYIKYKLC